MNKKIVSSLVLGVLAFMLVMPAGRVWAQTGDASIEALQKQVGQLLEMIKSLQAQIEAIRSGVKPPIISIRPEPERGWDTINGTLQAQNLDGRTSFYMWGTHQITEPIRLTYPTQGGKTYLVKAVNDEVLAMLKKYEGQTVTLWGQLQYQNIEGGFWGFIAKKVITGTTECPLPAAGTKIGYSGESVRVIQEVLKTDKSVYPEGLVTGYYGPLTARAVTKFQTKVGLPATGVLDTETRERIEAKLEATSQSVPGSMGVTVQVDPIEDRVIRCPIPPKPIPVPIPDQGFRVYSPSAGETWQPGQTYKIAWTTNPYYTQILIPTAPPTAPGSGEIETRIMPTGPVRITLHKYIACLYEGPVRCLIAEAMPYVIAEKTDNDGIFEWAIPADIAAQYQGKMVITVSAVDGGFSGRSAVFAIGNTTPRPEQSVKVYSPAFSETWFMGQTYKIAWTSALGFGQMGPATIYLTNYQGPCSEPCPASAYMPYTIAKGVENTGVFVWTIPKDLPAAYQGKVRINVIGADGSNGLSEVFSVLPGTTTNNLPPVVTGVSGPTVLKVGETGTWTVKAYDPENGSLSYSVLWGDEVMVPLPQSGEMLKTPLLVQNTATFTHSYNNAGIYTPRFTVMDDRGQSAKTSISVVVGGGTTNSPPKITGISAIPTPIYVGQQANFSWSATDADGDRLSWSVNWGDSALVSPSVTCLTSDGSNPNCWNFNAGHTWNNAGAYTVKVTVTDTKGASDSYNFNVTVSPQISTNQPPVIKTFQFQNGVTSLSVGQMYILNYLAVDPEGTQVKYTIDFGDGTIETANMFGAGTTGASLHTYTTAGTKTLKLTATDATGLSATQSLTVNVVSQNLGYQIINFNQGWNFVSFYRLPDSRALRTVFPDEWLQYINVIKTVENGQELVYDKTGNVQTLNTIQFDNGYKVHTTQAFSMYVYGLLPTESERKTHLVRNLFNFVGYPSETPRRVDQVFSSANGIVNAMISIVKDGSGKTWTPGYPNYIGDMKPGQGYEVWINPEFTNNQDIDFTFPQ